jgi:hypothetical protein
MIDKTHNGWTNYETWRVNLEIFDGMGAGDFVQFSVFSPNDSIPQLMDALKEYAIEIIEMDGAKGLAFDYAMAFLQAVNWQEIARHMIEDYIEEYAAEE